MHQKTHITQIENWRCWSIILIALPHSVCVCVLGLSFFFFLNNYFSKKIGFEEHNKFVFPFYMFAWSVLKCYGKVYRTITCWSLCTHLFYDCKSSLNFHICIIFTVILFLFNKYFVIKGVTRQVGCITSIYLGWFKCHYSMGISWRKNCYLA